MKAPTIALILASACLLPPAGAQADTHRPALDAKIQETPRSACLGREQAEAEAGNLALKSAQTYCRREGFGWRAAQVKDFGALDCQRCGGGQTSCGYAALALECRKAGPRLALTGWLAGKF